MSPAAAAKDDTVPPPAPKPRYFISAVSPEFATLRKKVDEVLRFLAYDAETMEIWGTGAGDLHQLLRDKIDACDGLIQIVGDGYGAEPPSPDPAFGRVSYTQFEYRHAAARRKRTWLLFATPAAPRDNPSEHLDRPPVGHPDPVGYQAERRDLQTAYRASLRAGGHGRYSFGDITELENIVLKLRDDSERLRREFRDWQRQLVEGQRRSGRWMKLLLGAIAVMMLLGAGAAASEARPDESERLFDQVLETDPDWPEALTAAGWFYRDRAVFEERHGTLAAALPLARKALRCAKRLNANPSVTVGTLRFQTAAELQMAKILAKRGQPGDTEQALAHFKRGLEIAERLLANNPRFAEATSDLSVSLNKLGDFLAQRGQPGDAVQALAYYQRRIDLHAQQMTDNPRSAEAARDLVLSHWKLVAFGLQTGDQALARGHFGEGRAVLLRCIDASITFKPFHLLRYRQLQAIFGGDGETSRE